MEEQEQGSYEMMYPVHEALGGNRRMFEELLSGLQYLSDISMKCLKHFLKTGHQSVLGIQVKFHMSTLWNGVSDAQSFNIKSIDV